MPMAGDDIQFRLLDYQAAFGMSMVESVTAGEIRLRSMSSS